MWNNLRADTRRLREIKKKGFPGYVIESLLFENGYQAVVMYRMASWFKHRGIPLLGPLIARISLFLTGVDIAPGARIGPGLRIAHGDGIVVGDRVVIGSDATLLHQVTIGAASLRRVDRMPHLGDDVFVGAGARLIGEITVGDEVFIGVNTIVLTDIPGASKVTSSAELVIETRGESREPSAPR